MTLKKFLKKPEETQRNSKKPKETQRNLKKPKETQRLPGDIVTLSIYTVVVIGIDEMKAVVENDFCVIMEGESQKQ
jgi:hypothetical protein